MYFNLKEPNAKTPTLILLMYYVKSENKKFKYSTGKKIKPADWDGKARLPKNLARRNDLKILTSYLNKYSEFLNLLINDYELRNQPLTRQILKDRFDLEFKGMAPSSSDLLIDYFDQFIESKKAEKKYTALSVQKYVNVKNVLQEYQAANKIRLYFAMINDGFYAKYTGYLRAVRNYQDNTLARHIVFLKTFLRWAERNGYNQYNHYKGFSAPTRESDHIALTENELIAIENVTLKTKDQQQAKDLFLIGCYSGQRFSDFSVFESADIQDGMIIKHSKKMKQKSFIPLHSRLLALLEKYKWKLPIIPDYEFITLIRIVCEKAGISQDFKRMEYRGNERQAIIQPRYELVGTHTARRTFITLSAEKGMPDHIIMSITGIRDVKTLQRYKKVNKSAIKESAAKYWD